MVVEGNASKSRVKKLDFMTPEGAEKKGEKKVASSYDGGEDEETDPRLLQLVSKAQARGDPSLVLFLRKAFQVSSRRSLRREKIRNRRTRKKTNSPGIKNIKIIAKPRIVIALHACSARRIW